MVYHPIKWKDLCGSSGGGGGGGGGASENIIADSKGQVQFVKRCGRAIYDIAEYLSIKEKSDTRYK